MEDISTSTERLGHEFKLPKLGAPIWAEIDLRPTFLGPIFAALFKPPQLHITLRYEDGDAESFRYVAAMGRSGFIISPVIHDILQPQLCGPFDEPPIFLRCLANVR